MRLLHITATHLNYAGGIPVVLKELVQEQNQVNNFVARVLSIKADITQMNSEFFDILGKQTFEEYIDAYKPDIVIFHNHYCLEYLSLYKILTKKSIKYFIEPHGTFGKQALRKSRIKKLIANVMLFHRYMKSATGYIYLNESEKKESCFHVHNEVIIPNGIKEMLQEIVEEKHNELKFYFIGRFDVHHKGLDMLFDALEILDKRGEDFTIELYGTGTNKEISYLDKRINGLSKVLVKNCGPIRGEQKDAILEQKGIMVLTSRYEGFPMTILEAWSYGNPCLVTPGTNVSSEVYEHGLGWVTRFEKESIANTMSIAKQAYLENAGEYKKKCKGYVVENYSWDKIAKLSYEVLSVYLS